METYPTDQIAAGMLVRAYRHLRSAKLRRRWTQKQAAKWWGVSERTWRRYEKGEIVSVPLLKRIAKNTQG